ncbi:MAG: DUF21 domain-containing protein [Candidatus Omnitrophota bacterium]|nr:MAG: DUF21 domain-containing protein [Candidatus Omnitrophota bacterium]
MMYLYLFGCIFFIFLQGFFAASEISFISSSLLKLRHRQDKGDKCAARAYKLLLNPEKFLVTTLVGTNICVVLSSSLLTFFLIQLGIQQSNLWTTIVFTPLVVIFAELIPKNIGRYYREGLSSRFAGIITFFEKILAPVVITIEKASKLLVKMFMKKVKPRSPFVTKEEIKSLIKEIEKEGGIDRGEKEAIEEVFEFRLSRIKDVCVSVRHIIGLDYSDSYENILKVIREKGFTRYPVFKNKQIKGYINTYDLFYNPQGDWHALIRPITKVGFNQKLYEVFTGLKARKESIALVLKGKKTYGIVTLQDLIREIITPLTKEQ